MAAITGQTPKLLEPPVTSQGNPVSGVGFVNFNPPSAMPTNEGWKGDPITGVDNDGTQGPGPGSREPFNQNGS